MAWTGPGAARSALIEEAVAGGGGRSREGPRERLCSCRRILEKKFCRLQSAISLKNCLRYQNLNIVAAIVKGICIMTVYNNRLKKLAF